MALHTLLCGGYTSSMAGDAHGVGTLLVDDVTGRASFVGTAVEVSSPSYLLAHEGVLYVADEGGSRIVAFGTHRETLVELGAVATSGAYPCHMSASEGMLFVANYGDGSIDCIELDAVGAPSRLAQTLRATGRGPLPQQDGPHAHSTLSLPSGRLLSADLGVDRVFVHERSHGRLERVGELHLPDGTGPRDLLLLGERVVLLGEFGSQLHELDEAGIVRSGELVSDPATGDQAAGLVAGPDGRFLYAGLRGSNRIAVVDAASLEPVAAFPCGGDWPRHLAVVGGLLMASCQRSGTVAVFRLDPETGFPHPLGEPVTVPTPTFIVDASALDFAAGESLVK